MKILHTSDWHIGRTLHGRKRYDEFETFLTWLSETIDREQIEVLLVAGDVFDTSAPSNRAQQLYYQFLRRTARSCCRHVLVTAGNHDSPSFLTAPKELLRDFGVHVVGTAEHPSEEVLVLEGKSGAPALIVCAVPYLRDRDIRTVEAGESIGDKDLKLLEGIQSHYAAVLRLAEEKRTALGPEIPIIVMGHLFTAGGQTIDDDGVRELYVGSLAHVPATLFPPQVSYTALGHLHVPQRVNGSDTIRYSGSPLPMGFGEARQEKSVCVVALEGVTASVRTVPVDVPQRLARVRAAEWETIALKLAELAGAGKPLWLEVVYDGSELLGDLRSRVEAAVAGSGLEILRTKNNRIADRFLNQLEAGETLQDLDVNEVFARCLAAHAVPEEQRPELRRAYHEVLASLQQNDPKAE